ncbi:SpoIIE family protein phosphatase [Kitasatospora paracochleata]|uniref:SpoIIE family protein phosphatase n=1 Tax=Kitasatospora paracochleata TaxID=58354 RepID=UPI0031E3E81B
MLDDDADDVPSAVFEALFAQAPLGLFVFDEELRVVRYNPAGQGVRGIPAERIVGHRIADFAPSFHSVEFENLARRVLDDGAPVRGLVVRGRNPEEPEHELVVSASLFRLRLDSGRALGVAAVENITDRQAALDRLEILHAAHRQLGTSLDATGTAEAFTAVTVPRFADAAAVDLVDEAIRGRPPRPGPVAAETPMRRASFRSLHGSSGAVLPGELSTFPIPTPFTQAMDDARPRLIEELRLDDPWLAVDPERARRLTDAGVNSMIVLPLTVQDTVLGLAALYRTRRREPFSREDFDLAGELAARAALGIDHARSYTRERHTATILQRHLLPKEPPELTGVEAAHLHLTGRIGTGGDWYDVIPLSGARVCLAIAAVAGEGIEAAATMGQLRTALRTLAVQDLPPDELLLRLDETARVLAAEQAEPGPGTPGPIATCLYLVYDPVDRTCVAASAGHPAPLAIGPDGAPMVYDIDTGPPLGRGDGWCENTVLELSEGSLLALYTPGLLTARPAERVGPLDRLRHVLARTDQDLRALCDGAAYALVPAQPESDVMLLLVRTHALETARVASWTFQDNPAVVREARRGVARQLGSWGLGDLVDSTNLIVSELVTNAIRYGTPPIRLRMILDQELICEVSDSSNSAPHLRRARSTDEGGRGLFIIGHLADRWGTRFSRRGKTIWAEQPLDGEAVEGEAPDGKPPAALMG